MMSVFGISGIINCDESSKMYKIKLLQIFAIVIFGSDMELFG